MREASVALDWKLLAATETSHAIDMDMETDMDMDMDTKAPHSDHDKDADPDNRRTSSASSSQAPTELTTASLPPPLDDDALLATIADQVQQRAIPAYLEAFDDAVPDQEIVVGAVPLVDVQQRERDLEHARLRHKTDELAAFQQRELQLLQHEQAALARVQQDYARRTEQLARERLLFAQSMRLRAQRLALVFAAAETQLVRVLQRQHARVQRVFGRLAESSIPAERRQYRVEWEHAPVTLELRAELLRAVKDKLPRGRYTLLVTLYDRLGGHALHWTEWEPQQQQQQQRDSSRPNSRKRRRAERAAAAMGMSQRCDRPSLTRPFVHRGRFFHSEVPIHQPLFVVCPPPVRLRPGNVLIFELCSLGDMDSEVDGKADGSKAQLGWRGCTTSDPIVAWGALPVLDPDFAVVQGQFKVPLLRGEMDTTMDKYRDMEALIAQDLSAWLCNLYVKAQVVRGADVESDATVGQQQQQQQQTPCSYDVEIDARNGVYRIPATAHESGDAILRARRKLKPRPSTSTIDGKAAHANGDSVDRVDPATSATLLVESSVTTSSDQHATATSPRSSWLPWRRRKKRPRHSNGTRVLCAGDIVVPELDMDDDHDHDDGHATDAVATTNVASPTAPALAIAAVHKQLSAVDLHPSATSDDLPSPSATTTELDLENYRASVNPAVQRETARHQRFHTWRKLRYMRHELLADLGVSNLHTLECWLLLLLLALALWLRVFVHYLAQWLYLKAQRVPVVDFRVQWTTCMVQYTSETVATRVELGVVSIGVLGNILMFAGFVGAAALSQLIVGELPAFASKWIVCVGVAAIVDPLLVLLVDLMNHQFSCSSRSECRASLISAACRCVEGDAFKLYERFLVDEGSGVVGIAVTLLLYAALACGALVAFYLYLLHVHMNGRMLDVYRRVHALECDLFVPHDGEVSMAELQAICTQAVRWKGPRGTQRQVVVHDYELRDPMAMHGYGGVDVSTHIAVYNIELDGTRELYRHFLKAQDGTIVELFGAIGPAHDGTWTQDAAPGLASLGLLLQIWQQQPARATVAALLEEI